VDDTNTFHDDISWLADAGVTLGCNPPANANFCPEDNVTRGQMSAFMRRFAAYLGAEDGTVSNADDAQTLAGFTPPQLVNVTGNPAGSGLVTLNSFTNASIQQISVNAPVDGYLMIQTSTAYLDTDDSLVLQWLQLDATTCSNSSASVAGVGFAYGGTSATTRYNTVSVGAVIAATAGDHTLIACAREFSSNGDPQYYPPTVQVMFSPFGTIVPGLPVVAADAVIEGTDG
jgi:hypothetical protein